MDTGELPSSFEDERKTDVWADRRAEKKSKAGVAVFAPWIERSRLLPFLPLFPFSLDLQRVLSLIDGFGFLTLRIA